MKKYFCIFFLLIGFASAISAQDLIIPGTFQSKPIKIWATQKPGSSDYIVKRIEYAPYDKLQSDVSSLSKQLNDCKKQREKLEVQIKQQLTVNDCDTTEFVRKINAYKNQLSIKRVEYDTINARLEEKEHELANMESELKQLQNVLEKDQERIEDLVKKNEDLRRLVDHRDLNDDVITASGLLGGDMFKNKRIGASPWTSNIVFAQQIELTYTHYLSKESPFAVRFGVGLSRLHGRASFGAASDTIMGLTDGDGDSYDARYSFCDVEEVANLRYLDIPLMLHIGNSYTTFGVQAWIEAGLKASIRIKSSLSGSGTYSVQGYYPAYNVVVTDIPSAGFVSDSSLPYSGDADVNGFVLWGQIAAGLNIPIVKNLSFMLGVKGAYTLLPISKGDNSGDGRLYEVGKNSLLNGGATRIFLAGVELGLSYKF